MSTDLVIILSSDWVGSTATRAQLGEDRADALQEVHDALLRKVIAAEGGRVVKHYGDGVLATFPIHGAQTRAAGLQGPRAGAGPPHLLAHDRAVG
jgi:class 3 adenylate cyclase